MKIAILEDQRILLDQVKTLMVDNGFNPVCYTDGLALVNDLKNHQFELFILDWLTPKMNGQEVMSYIRNDLQLRTPILFLTSNSEPEDIALTLGRGADDYCPKPVKSIELVARVKALIRRSKSQYDQINHIQVGPYSLDNRLKTLSINQLAIPLTDREFSLAWYLFVRTEQAICKNTIALSVFNIADPTTSSRTIDTHIYSLKKKLKFDENKLVLRTIRGFGYRLSKND